MSKWWNPSEWGKTEKTVFGISAGVVLGVCVYKYLQQKEKITKTVEEKAGAKETAHEMRQFEEELDAMLMKTLTKMQETGSLEKETEDGLLTTIQGHEENDNLSPATRVLVAQYCHVLFSLRMSAGEISTLKPWEIKELRESLANTYLNLAWTVLSSNLAALDPTENSIACALKLDIACRLHDPVKMRTAYNEAVLTTGKDLSSESRLVLLASACLLGDTKEIKRLGEGLQVAELQALHAAAIKDNSIIDYAALYGLSEQDEELGSDGPVEALKVTHLWNAYEVVSVNFYCPEGTKAPLRPDLTSGTWSRIEPPKSLHLIRTGAAVSYVNPGVIPIPLSGFAGEKGMVLTGYFDIDREEDTVRVATFITLTKDPKRPSMYVGKELETVYCVSGEHAGQQQEEVCLDLQVEMEVDDNVLYKIT